MTDAQAKTISLKLRRTQHGLFRDCSICHKAPTIKMALSANDEWFPWRREPIFTAMCCGYLTGWYMSMKASAAAWNEMVQQVEEDIESAIDEMDFGTEEGERNEN